MDIDLVKIRRVPRVLIAVVVAIPRQPVRPIPHAYVVAGSPALLEDIDEGINSRHAGDSIGEPDGGGIWIWEGNIVVRRGSEGDDDVDYVGEYRRATEIEIALLVVGAPLGLWQDEPDEPEQTDA